MSGAPRADASRNDHAGRIVRALAVALITVWSLATTAPDIALSWHPLSTYGFFHKGGQLTNVRPGSAAADAGLKIGDRIDLTAMTIDERHHLYGAVYANSARPGEPLTLTIERDGKRERITLRSRLLQRTFADNLTNIILILSQCAFVLIASWLVLFRPGVMTWACGRRVGGVGSRVKTASAPNG